MPQTMAPRRIRPPRICARLKPAKNVRLVRAGAGGEAGGAGRSSSGCSAIAGVSLRSGRGHDPVPPQNDEARGEDEMGHGEDGLERRHAGRGGDDVAGGEIVELVHQPIEREAPNREEEEREQTPGHEQGRGEETCEMQPDVKRRPQIEGRCAPRRFSRLCAPGRHDLLRQIGRAVQQECRDRSRMPSSA
eukprot:TRINITY_DN5936_c0_g1_i1.p1 TRINITY_DN5936_c0_g1~~TRINITY_DN5936_c0_g1_i1.p1  ORF type:complete len:190 (-),score=18.86 TRINITY_DN5936_c0_g1_i1:25-594(-)